LDQMRPVAQTKSTNCPADRDFDLPAFQMGQWIERV